MSKYDIRPKFECQNRILNIKIRYSARFRMSKYDIRPDCECQNGFRMSKYDIQNPILTFKLGPNIVF